GFLVLADHLLCESPDIVRRLFFGDLANFDLSHVGAGHVHDELLIRHRPCWRWMFAILRESWRVYQREHDHSGGQSDSHDPTSFSSIQELNRKLNTRESARQAAGPVTK